VLTGCRWNSIPESKPFTAGDVDDGGTSRLSTPGICRAPIPGETTIEHGRRVRGELKIGRGGVGGCRVGPPHHRTLYESIGNRWC
jgi:hypothetical protein